MLKTQHINTIAIIDAEIQRKDGVRMRERGEGEKEKKNSHHPERKKNRIFKEKEEFLKLKKKLNYGN